MLDTIFQKALEATLREEGGLADRPMNEDPGGLTMMGITQATLSSYRRRFPGEGFPLSPRNLTRKQAERIYRRFYWEEAKCDQLPPCLAGLVFDVAVMSGPRRAVLTLQQAMPGVDVDGWIGPATLSMAQRSCTSTSEARKLIDRFCDIREGWLLRRRNAKHNPGWFPRLKRMKDAAWFSA